MPLTSLAILAVVILSIRGTLGHRPMNPSSVAYSSDGMLNTLALNSLYNVFYAVYSMKNEKSASAVYGNMDEAEMHERVLRQAGLPVPPANADYPSLHAQPATRKTKRPLNVVIILEESLGAQYSAALGGANLTPELDALARESWAFTRAYATGTRSVRGLEAVVTGFLPTPAQAVLKLPRSQRGFFSLADLLGRHGYHSRFIYGGESHFDNMKGFSWAMVSSRSWTARTSWIRPSSAPGAHRTKTCSTSWTGCCAQTATSHFHAGLQRLQPFALGVPGRPHPGRRQSATVENTVRYADWALGRFFERAKASPYWENTVFLVAADHDSRVFGASLVPVRHFHIPAVILGAGIEPRRDERLISQIDLAPTLLSLTGVDTEHPMIGHDLTRSTPGRAIMQYDNTYGYLKEDRLLVMAPSKTPVQYRYTAPEDYTPEALDPELAREALAHALWPSWAYREAAMPCPARPGREPGLISRSAPDARTPAARVPRRHGNGSRGHGR